MAATIKDIKTMLERGEQPPTPPLELLTAEENARVEERMRELFGGNPKEEPNDGNKT